MLKILPIGPRCHANRQLDAFPKLKEHKVFYSPFNGGVFNGTNIVDGKVLCPQREFLFNREWFMEKYCNPANWEYVGIRESDGKPMFYNDSLNLSRWHVKVTDPAHPLDQTLAKCKKSMAEVDFHEVLFITTYHLDYNKIDFKQLQWDCEKAGYKMLCLYETQYKDYVDTTLSSAVDMGVYELPDGKCPTDENFGANESLKACVTRYYRTHHDDMLKRLSQV